MASGLCKQAVRSCKRKLQTTLQDAAPWRMLHSQKFLIASLPDSEAPKGPYDKGYRWQPQYCTFQNKGLNLKASTSSNIGTCRQLFESCKLAASSSARLANGTGPVYDRATFVRHFSSCLLVSPSKEQLHLLPPFGSLPSENASISPVAKLYFSKSFSVSKAFLLRRHEAARQKLKAQKEQQSRLAQGHETTSQVALQTEPVYSSASQPHAAFDASDLQTVMDQPPPTQPLIGPLSPRTPEEEKLAAVLARPDLMITRQIEYLNIFVGFEQQNRYVIVDPHKALTVGFLLEDSNVILRQLLRRRRPWEVNIFNVKGEHLCTVKRKFFWIASSATVYIGGEEVGWVHQRWHLWKRNYDVYVKQEDGTKSQFATVENPGFWWWTFTLKNERDEALAEIDRNFRGLGLELFTDAGQYMVRFGDISEDDSASHSPSLEGMPQQKGTTQEGQQKLEQLAQAANEVPKLEVARPLSLVERAVTLALAVSIDNDFFSRHSNEGGILPFGVFSSQE